MERMAEGPCATECDALIDLAERLVEEAPGIRHRFERWTERAKVLRQRDDLESIAGEKALDELALDLRYHWLRFANSYSSRLLKSPRSQRDIKMPLGLQDSYPYDRWNHAERLEERCLDYHPPIAGWSRKSVFYSSGMAAVAGTLQVVRKLYGDLLKRRLHFLGFGAYWEIEKLLRTVDSLAMSYTLEDEQADFLRALADGNVDFLFCQSIANNWHLSPLDLDELGSAWRQSSTSHPDVVIIDTSLSGNSFPFDAFLDQLGPKRPSLVARISSGLKLDQEGLEWGNVGIVTLYTPDDDTHGQDYVDRMAGKLRQQRYTSGLGLYVDTLAALEFPTFLDATAHLTHAEAVFESNKRFAQEFPAGGDIFAAVSHPALSSDAPSWAESPVVNIRLASTDETDKYLIQYVLKREVRKRKLPFYRGSSFGFRHHRYETRIYGYPGMEIIRIAVGRCAGPSLAEVLKLFSEIADYGDIAGLRAAYPDLAARAVRRMQAKETKRTAATP